MSFSAVSGIKSAGLGLWLPEPHDSLTQTLCKVYGISFADPLLKEVVALHLALNPEIFAAHRPLQQKVIYLADLQLQRGGALGASQQNALLAKLNVEKASLAGSKRHLETIVPRSAVEVEAMRFVLGFNEVMGHIGTGLGIGSATAGTLTGRHLHSDILSFNRWANEKASLLKTGRGADILHHYDARMDDVVKRITRRLGPTQRFLFNGTGTEDALFNGVPQSLRPDPVTISAAERIKQVAGAAKFGGAALVLVDGALTCQKLSATPQVDKVQTAYKEIGGFAGSLLTGAAVGIAVASMATPVGWLGAIVISAGAAYGGKTGGEFFFDKILQNGGDVFDLKNGRLLNSWCN
jgi:hypothetical protein